MDEQTALRQRPGDQPLPIEGREAVTPRVIANIARMVREDHRQTAIGNILAARLNERTALGIQRYGRPLESHNGRNPRRDLAEELLDAAQYAEQDAMERPDDHAARVVADGVLQLLLHVFIEQEPSL